MNRYLKTKKKLCCRLAFIEDYTLKSLRLKTEKWNKLVISDDQRGFLHSFVDQGSFVLKKGKLNRGVVAKESNSNKFPDNHRKVSGNIIK